MQTSYYNTKQFTIYIKSIFLFVFILFYTIITAQSKIIGTIVDNSSRPLTFASVYLQSDNLNENTPGGTLSTDSGKFIIYPVQTGGYTLNIKLIGYKDYKKHVQIDGNLDLKNIKLSGDSSLLSDVVVTSHRPIFEKKIDRFIFNVANAPITVGGSAWDVLQHTPLITSNNSGSLSIIGNSSVAVYINNRKSFLSGEDLVNYLQAMPADNIVSIQVITSPPANYDAGRGGGVINIVLKKIMDNGLKGSLTLSDQQATYNRQRASLQLNYKHNRYTQSLIIGGGLGKIFTKFDNTIKYFDINQKEIVDEKYISDKKPVSASTSIEYNISKNSTIGGLLDYSHSQSNIQDHAIDDVYTNENLSSYINNNKSQRISNMVSGNLFYKFLRKKNNQSLVLNLDYFNYHSNNSGTFFSNYAKNLNEIYNGNMSDANQKARNSSLKIDYSQQIFNSVTLESGLKYVYTDSKNPYMFYNYSNGNWIFNPHVSNYFIYKEGIMAAYVSLEKRISTKFNIKVGARLENTNIKTLQQATDEHNTQNYTRVLPTAYILYKINNNSNLSFSIRNDFVRPPFYVLNPFKDYTSNKVIEVGNPFIRPSNNLSYELSYVLKNNYVLMAQYHHNTSLFSQIQTIISPDTLLYQQQNYGKSDMWSLISVINQPIVRDKWSINLTNTIQWVKYDVNAGLIQSNKENIIYTATLNQTFKNVFNLGVDASIYGMYQSKLADANIIGRSFGEVDIGISKSFSKAGLKVAFYANDIFKTSIFNSYSIGSSSFKSDLRSYYDTQFIRISLSKTFGNKKVKKVQPWETGNKNEKNRLN